MEKLVSLHGWEALGAVMEAIMEEKKLRMLVKCGVPFLEAAKMIGFR